ncbi:porin [Billgrantia endophytica]|nr:porin [Halomonas endophytica]
MKKTLLATAIAGALGVSAAAQAATVYDQDGTQVDVYGRINFGLTTGGLDGHNTDDQGRVIKESGSEFIDVFSRFGFRARHQVSSDLLAFANMEIRPQLDRQHNSSPQIRNSFVGLTSDPFGTVRVGNFDGMVYQAITGLFEIQEYEGYTTLSGGATAARGDSIAYSTPDLEGFQAHVQAKHLSGNNAPMGGFTDPDTGEWVEVDNSSTQSWQSAVTYTWNDLFLGLGYNQSKDVEDRGASYDGGGANPAGEDVWVGAVVYDFTPAFRLGVKYEEVTDLHDQDRIAADAEDSIENMWTLMGVFDYGMGELYADYNRVRYALDGVDSGNRWTLGANYRFSQPMYVWAEVVDYDFDSDQSISDIDDDLRLTVGVRYDF